MGMIVFLVVLYFIGCIFASFACHLLEYTGKKLQSGIIASWLTVLIVWPKAAKAYHDEVEKEE